MSKASRREARERLRQERLKEQKRANRNKMLLVLGAVGLAVILFVGLGITVINLQQGSSNDEQWSGTLPQQTLQQDGSVVLAEESAQAPVVEVYADYQCPHCGRFETENGDTLKQLAADGEAIVHYRPVSIFFSQQGPTAVNSLRAGAVARAAADYGKFVEYNDKLFDHQPAEGQEGYSPDELKTWGEEVGIEDAAFAERVDAENEIVQRFVEDYFPQLNQQARDQLSQDELGAMTIPELMEWGADRGIDFSFLEGTYVNEVLDATWAVNERYSSGENAFSGTPAVYINGQLQTGNFYDPQVLTSAVQSAEPGSVDTQPAAGDDSLQPSGDASPAAEE
ncbi:DsbA family protein [Salinactinospora qingdaonensis]|uniref:Thioredoxin-like fold domain-containing protein n=1 Tax=Salinactinospora qingdaonensis TaxID=702744 RepID=A0ABP7FMH5_9ACTN